MTDIRIDLTGLSEITANLSSAPKVIEEEVTLLVTQAALAGSNIAKDIVGKKTHALERSLTPVVSAWAGGTISAAWGTNLPYARVHEEGHGGIVPKNKKVLRFEIGGKVIFARRVKPVAGKFYMKKSHDRIRTALPNNAERTKARIIQRIQNGGA